jgi:predicted DsbA family dithiol-disulfide isomerase
MRLKIDVVSDVICPWCYIGKRRLERALAMLAPEQAVELAWRPFELNPGMPREGVPRREYRTRKFGSWERSQELDQRVTLAAAEEGLAFSLDRQERTPNTLDAHRLLWLAEQERVQDAVAERLFRAYFVEGVDVGSRERLAELAADAGMDAGAVSRFLAGPEGVDEVRREEARYRTLGVDGVPFVIINNHYAVSGAQRPEVFLQAFRQALAEQGAAPAAGDSSSPAANCSPDQPGVC